jgi:transcriptional regulator with XRE-family HTH domain
MAQDTDYDKFLRKVAENIRRCRKRVGLTQMDMIDHGFNYRHYQRIESGDTGPSLSTLYKLAKIFKVKPSTLLDV